MLQSVDRPLNSQYVNPALDPDESNAACFSSDHTGSGVHFVFVDGHVDFISDDIDHVNVLQALATRAGEESVDTGNL